MSFLYKKTGTNHGVLGNFAIVAGGVVAGSTAFGVGAVQGAKGGSKALDTQITNSGGVSDNDGSNSGRGSNNINQERGR